MVTFDILRVGSQSTFCNRHSVEVSGALVSSFGQGVAFGEEGHALGKEPQSPAGNGHPIAGGEIWEIKKEVQENPSNRLKKGKKEIERERKGREVKELEIW